jgi:LSD1 subclass zinc finger protein
VVEDDAIVCRNCKTRNPPGSGYCESCHKLLAARADDLGLDGPPKPRPGSDPSGTSGGGRGKDPYRRILRAKPIKVDAVDLRCRACGAPLKLPRQAGAIACEYCGTVLLVHPPPTSRGAPDAPRDPLGVGNEWDSLWVEPRASYSGGATILFGAWCLLLGGGFSYLNLTAQNCSQPVLPPGPQTCTSAFNLGAAAFFGFIVLCGLAFVGYGIWSLWVNRND